MRAITVPRKGRYSVDVASSGAFWSVASAHTATRNACCGIL